MVTDEFKGANKFYLKKLKEIIKINKFRHFIPSGITALRVILVPIFLYAFISDLRMFAIGIFLFACITDALDGYFARKLEATSSYGAHFDTLADFLLVLAAFLAFAVKGIYPFWVLLLITFMFLQFILTSKFKRIVYDPIGKYYGSFLFAVIAITLTFPDIVYNFSIISIVLFSFTSITSRFLFFQRKRNIYSVVQIFLYYD